MADGLLGQGQRDRQHRAAGQLDHRQPPHGQERGRQPEPGLEGPHHLGVAPGVGVEPVADLGDLRFVGVARDQAGVSLGDQPGRLGPDGRVVGRRVTALADRCVGQGPVDPEHGRDSGHCGDERDAHDQDAEHDQPPLGVIMQQRPDARDEGHDAQQQGRRERHGQPPQPAGHHPVQQPRAQEGGRVTVGPPDAFQQGAGLVPGGQLGQHLPDHVVAQRSVDRGPRVVERVVLVELVAVHDPDQLDAGAGLDGQVAGQRQVGHAEPLAQDGHRLLVPGQLAVVVAGGDHHAVILVRGEALDRVGELGVGIQDPGHVRGGGQHLEPVTGDDQHPGQVEGVQHLGQFVSGVGGYFRGRGREVQVAHHDHPVAPAHLELNEIGNVEGVGGPVRGPLGGGLGASPASVIAQWPGHLPVFVQGGHVTPPGA